MDRRQQKSRSAIFAAFERLLAQQNYNKITVQQIIDEANVGRTTFYAHFETKDALLRELCTDLFNHILSKHTDSDSPNCFSFDTSAPGAVVTHIFYHLQDGGTALARLLTGESREVFLYYFKKYLNDLADRFALNNPKRSSSPLPRDLLLSHLSSSFVNMVYWWLQGGMKESPEVMADYFMALVEPIL